MSTETVVRTRRTQQSDAARVVTEFIDGLILKRNSYIPGPRLQRAVARIVPAQSRVKVRIAVTGVLAPRERRRARKIERSRPLHLHLGCGELPREGWVNVDLVGVPVDLAWNLGHRLPFADGSVDAIFHEHVLEHLPLDKGFAFTKECQRVLKPGGILRIGVPDAERHLGWYARGELATERREYATPLMSVLQEFYGFGHRVMYDFEMLALVCNASGFVAVEQRAFGDSRLDPAPDHPWREWDTLYVEMVK